MSNPALILIVDDHETQRVLFRLLAERLKVSAHVVSSAAEALEAIETYQFDAVLMDVIMPEMDGLECAKRIREMEKSTGRHVPIIAATACCYPADRDRCLEAGMDDYLGKPFTLQQLAEILSKWTNYELDGNPVTLSNPPALEELKKFREQLLADLDVAKKLSGPEFKELRTINSALALIDYRIENFGKPILNYSQQMAADRQVQDRKS